MTELANQIDETELLIDAARFGDFEDVQAALDEYKVSPDAADDQQRTGLVLFTVTNLYAQVRMQCTFLHGFESPSAALSVAFTFSN